MDLEKYETLIPHFILEVDLTESDQLFAVEMAAVAAKGTSQMTSNNTRKDDIYSIYDMPDSKVK